MRVLVTGGGGFLGGALVRALQQRGYEVVSLQRGVYPELNTVCFAVLQGDISNQADVISAAAGCDAVFHVAAMAGVWGAYADYYRVNVTGTQNIIRACEVQNIPQLIYTSSPSVVFSGADENGIDESAPYPGNYLTAYPATKALAEQQVLKANSESLQTVALRPHLIWGAGDQHLVPRIISRARAGRLKLVGNGHNLVDSTCIENAVQAHLLAFDALRETSACAGKAYFISNGEPVSMPDLINRILAAADLPPVTKTISSGLAYGVGGVLELVYRLLRIKREPLMTRFVARQLSCAHWYDLSAARRDLNYEPVVSLEQGLQRLQLWLQQQAAEQT